MSANSNYIRPSEHLIDLWGKRNPTFEKRYEQSVLRVLSDYGTGASEFTESKGKVFGAGYEVLIIAFFIGLYSNQRLPLSDDKDDIKPNGVGQPIDKWGNLDSKKLRKAYPNLRRYIFMALVAKTEDIDWIALEKGEIEVSKVVSKLIDTMEEYINYGLFTIEDKLKEDSGYFYSDRSFLNLFIKIVKEKDDIKEPTEAEPL